MKGNCDIIECQICKQEMSFGRIKRHISSRHKEITVEQYIILYYQTLPLHKPCEICKKNIVYKYKTCSKECQSKLEHGLKDKSKPEGFGIGKTFKCTKQNIKRPNAGGKGISRNKGKQPMLGKKHSKNTIDKMSISAKISFNRGERPNIAQIGIKRSIETIEKIFKKRKINKLEKFVSYILDKNNIEYNFQFFLNKDGVCKSYDFKLKGTNILLEIDGDYWHGGPSLNKYFYKLEEVKQNDLFKDQFAKDNGFMLLRFWESDIYKNPEIIIDKIKEFTKCHHSKE